MAVTRLTDRARRILVALVREYIETGQPVGSVSLVKRSGIGLSSATVRNELARLEEMGLVRQPHTSAGRVPTDLGYRSYVDLLLQARRPHRATTALLEAGLRAHAGKAALMNDVLAYVSHVVSEESHHVGFALGPRQIGAAFHQIDFVPLAGSAILVVVVARGGDVSQKVVDLGERFDPTELRQAANFINSEFTGRTLAEVRALVEARLREERTLYDALVSRALRLASSTFRDLPTENALFIEGAASLIETIDFAAVSAGTLRTLLQMVEEKHRLVRLLTAYMEGPGLTVVIGSEHASPDLRGFSLVASTYLQGTRTGGVGIIGPTRMHYSRAIALVDTVARAMSRVLNESGWADEDRSHC